MQWHSHERPNWATVTSDRRQHHTGVCLALHRAKASGRTPGGSPINACSHARGHSCQRARTSGSGQRTVHEPSSHRRVGDAMNGEHPSVGREFRGPTREAALALASADAAQALKAGYVASRQAWRAEGDGQVVTVIYDYALESPPLVAVPVVAVTNAKVRGTRMHNPKWLVSGLVVALVVVGVGAAYGGHVPAGAAQPSVPPQSPLATTLAQASLDPVASSSAPALAPASVLPSIAAPLLSLRRPSPPKLRSPLRRPLRRPHRLPQPRLGRPPSRPLSLGSNPRSAGSWRG